jgi:DNA-binding beta-propeller fold protein YncE
MDPGRIISCFLNHYLLVASLCVLLLGQNLTGSTVAFGASSSSAIITPTAQVTIDADGKALRYPTFLYFDHSADEIYLSTGGRQVVVYASDYFPIASFGPGRGIVHPMDGFIDDKGLIYLCQTPSKDKPARISIFNGAFMLVREISLDNIPGVSGFKGMRVAVSRDGIIYVAGQLHRGVLVLDNDGFFLRWLRPVDEVIYRTAPISSEELEAEEALKTGVYGETSGSASDETAAEGPIPEIPEEYRPRTKEEKEAEATSHTGPVMIGSVTIDRSGKLYLTSIETSKTYVYNADESFLFSFGAKGGTPRTLSQPRGVAVDEEHNLIYVVDYMRHTILAYDQKGTYQFEFGGRGRGPGWFNFPTDIAVNRRGEVIVTDMFNHRIQALRIKYQPQLQQTTPPENTVESPGQADLKTEPLASPADEAVLKTPLSTDSTKRAGGEIEVEVIEDLELPEPPNASGDQENAASAPE